MKRYVKASLADEFERYHEDRDNYLNNPDGFDRMYDILNQYAEDENEDVREAFKRAPIEDQRRMVDLIKPQPKFGSREYPREMYYRALDCDIDNASAEYCKGVVDAIEALFAGGWVSEEDFRTDL